MARTGKVSSAPFTDSLLHDEDEIVPGIRTWWTGGHHRASLAVEVDSTVGTVVVSDAFFMYRNVEQDHPIGISVNIYEVLAAHTRARAVADHVVPLYDLEVFDRYPDGLVAPPHECG
jgi:glyoxylase-like metal-dependent hydrolase (beta-lactamase superfamily II)